MNLILASQSEGRKKLLTRLKIPFKVLPSTIDEDNIIGNTPLETIILRAKLKAEDVAQKVKESIILSADSGVILHNKLIGKPKNYEEAVRILKTLSGTTHRLVTAVYLIRQTIPKQTEKFSDRSLVTFRKLSDNTIKEYLSVSDYKRYAGGYAVPLNSLLTNSYSSQIIAKIEGSISNVIGLPLEKVIPVISGINLSE